MSETIHVHPGGPKNRLKQKRSPQIKFLLPNLNNLTLIRLKNSLNFEVTQNLRNFYLCF